LKQNGKQFDSCTSGKPFKFRLGGGEVIRGWDIGFENMRVGGKRQIIVPPNMGYGNKRMGNDIPANSTLVFDVELKAVS
jgi:FK506-binding nuclear protein